MRNLILLLSLLLINQSNAEEATSGNLLPNAGVGTTNLQNQSGSIDGINGSNGWTTSGISNFNNELEANGTGTVSSNGSLVGITTEKQNGGQFTTTADSLDGGVRLNSTTEVQNCEWSGSAHQCGQATNGRDSYSTTVNILDANNNSLATVTQNRNNDAGYYANTYTYTDTVIHNGTGARNWDWTWTGIDGYKPDSQSAVAPNLLGAELTATLLDIDYTILPPAIQTELTSFNNEISQEFREFEQILKIEKEIKIEETFTFEQPLTLQEFKFEEIKKEPKFEVIKEEAPMEQLEEAPMETMLIENKAPQPKEIKQKEELSGQGLTSKQEMTEEQESNPQESFAENKETNQEQKTTKQKISEPDKSDTASGDSKNNINVSLNKTMAKIDAKIKNIDKNLRFKNFVKIKAMTSNNLLEQYKIPFYKSKRIYENQNNIRDNRTLYSTKTLVSYTQNDPIFAKEKAINKIRLEKQRLINEIQVLKNG
mgnify:FL=1|tara:strand:+ start:6840 stop:8288 length:1449 start_codon:yes stop_codon:yes gene_type:complete